MTVASLLALATVLAGLRGALAQPPIQNQINISMCNWNQLRANVIRDTVYLDGGKLYWQRGLSDGTMTSPQSDGNPDGLIYTLNLGKSFDTSKDNLTSLFETLSKTGGAANNIAPTTADGVMFANDYEFYLYGGLVPLTDAYEQSPPADSVLGYERYQYGPPRPLWRPGFISGSTGDDVTRYVTHGAGVSAPSENLAFYFSGMRGEAWGPIMQVDPPANVTAETLIKVDMSTMREEEWSNYTLPDDVPRRANGELVWIPVSQSGVLVAIGGVVYPEDLFGRGSRYTDDQREENDAMGPRFTETVAVYDIASERWYLQNTTGDIPPPMSRFCSVVAPAPDRSSFNIYVYGGYNGTDPNARPYDDVYVLSVPTFKWIRVYDGESNQGRYGHKCFRPYPDKMLVIGGQYTSAGLCLTTPFIRVFNLNTLRFQDVYDPEDWEEYKVPDLVAAQIGGNADGDAEDEPEEWGHEDLEEIFDAEYTKTIATYYPYNPPVITARATDLPEDDGGGGGLPKWVPPVLGVVLGLVAVSAAVVIWFVWRRRRHARYGQSVAGTSETRNRILGWIPYPAKPEMTVASTELGINDKYTSGFSDGGFDSVGSPQPTSTVVYSEPSGPQEAASRDVYELPDTSPKRAAELSTDANATAASQSPTRERHLSDTSASFISPVSPPGSPPPDSSPPTSGPGHNRHNSSISSAGIGGGGVGFATSLDDAIARDEVQQQQQQQQPPRRTSRVVSAFTEEGMSSEPTPDSTSQPRDASQ